MRKMWQILTATVIGLVLVHAAWGADDLEPGDVAPGLDIEKWLNTSGITIQNDRVYLIYFFEFEENRLPLLIPFMQETYEFLSLKGLHVIGITNADADSFEMRFYKRRKQKVTFPIGVDRRNSTWNAWIDAAGVEAPSVFLVGRKGRVQYISNIVTGDFETIFPLVMEGRYDAELFRQAAPTLRAAENARRSRNWRMCHKLYDEVIKVDPSIFALYTLEKYETLLVDQDDADAAKTYAQTLLSEYSDDYFLLEDLSVMIATDPDIDDAKRDMEFALTAAEKAAELIDEDRPEKYSIPAKIYYHQGNYKKAVQLQKKAYFTAHPDEKEIFQRTLRNYQQAAMRETARVKDPNDPT